MFYSEKLPLIVVITGFIIFAVLGLTTVLTTANSGIKMDKYLCIYDINYSNFYEDSTVTSNEYYPREYIYDKTTRADDVCSYQKRDNSGNLTLERYEKCKNLYLNKIKNRYQNGECRQIGKEIFEDDSTDCEALYIWGTKKLISVKCKDGTEIQRRTAISKIKEKYQ